MKKVLGIVLLGLLWCNISLADDLFSILGVKLRDQINNYKILEDHGLSDTAKNVHDYTVSAKIENEYFDNTLSVATYGPQKKIYDITTYHKKKMDALSCQSLIKTIFNKKKSQFLKRGYQLEFNKNYDGSYDENNQYFKRIDAKFSNKDDSVLFISACDTSGKTGFNAEAEVWIIFRDDSLREIIYKEFLEKMEEDQKKEDKKKVKGF
ncbi:hypothetical protein [Candidatus Pelagibacter sp.]|uniref:hypothetical protein n=1 Tax=Candidatus Pelagibacter sp. TaxID=2024849 RepID=UPI003F8535FE